MAKFDEKALEKFIDQKINPPPRQPGNKRVLVDRLLNVARTVRARGGRVR